jgi:hypothetical protein
MISDPIGTMAAAMQDAPAADREMFDKPEVREVLGASPREAVRTNAHRLT